MSKPTPPKPDQARFQVRVVPRSSQLRLAVEPDGSLKAWVNALPVDGAANEAVCRLIAESLNVAHGAVSIIAGHTHRNKVVVVDGVGQADASFRLGAKCS